MEATGGDAVAFHQQPTERRVETWWTIELTEPHYIDLTFSCVPHASPPHGGLTIFFANYVWRSRSAVDVATHRHGHTRAASQP